MYHFTECDLNIKSVAQLKDVYSQIGCIEVVADKRVKTNWVQAILIHQSAQVEKVAVAEVKLDEIAASQQFKTCADCHLFKPFNDGTGRGLCCGVADTSLVVREHHTQTQDCQNLIDEQQAETQIPGYDFCLSQGIQFKQRVGSETGATYWYAQANHYYNQPGRQYKTSGFEKQENAVKAAVDYLGKCGVDVAETKQQIINHLQTRESVCRQEFALALIQTPVVQSGSLTFLKALSANPRETIYEVFSGVDSLGLVIKSGIFRGEYPPGKMPCECGCWYNSDSDDYVDAYATPYEAAAALLPTSPSELRRHTIAPEIEIDSVPDPDFGEMYRVWHGISLIGTFYRAADAHWVAMPCNSDDRPRCNTSAEAQLLIVALAGQAIADSPEKTVDELLDKPFDELTIADWQAIKQQAQLAELLAA